MDISKLQIANLRRITEAQLLEHFESILDSVYALEEPIVIERPDGNDVVLIPFTDEFSDLLTEYEYKWKFHTP